MVMVGKEEKWIGEDRINDQGRTKKSNVGHCGTNVVGKQE